LDQNLLQFSDRAKRRAKTRPGEIGGFFNDQATALPLRDPMTMEPMR
jgi:hypothetical protein